MRNDGMAARISAADCWGLKAVQPPLRISRRGREPMRGGAAKSAQRPEAQAISSDNIL